MYTELGHQPPNPDTQHQVLQECGVWAVRMASDASGVLLDRFNDFTRAYVGDPNDFSQQSVAPIVRDHGQLEGITYDRRFTSGITPSGLLVHARSSSGVDPRSNEHHFVVTGDIFSGVVTEWIIKAAEHRQTSQGLDTELTLSNELLEVQWPRPIGNPVEDYLAEEAYKLQLPILRRTMQSGSTVYTERHGIEPIADLTKILLGLGHYAANLGDLPVLVAHGAQTPHTMEHESAPVQA